MQYTVDLAARILELEICCVTASSYIVPEKSLVATSNVLEGEDKSSLATCAQEDTQGLFIF